MLEKVVRIISSWNKSKLSLASKVALLNFFLLTIPLYYLSVCPIPDTFLDKIIVESRKFLCSSSGSQSGIHLVNRRDITLDRSRGGGLSIKDLKTS